MAFVIIAKTLYTVGASGARQQHTKAAAERDTLLAVFDGAPKRRQATHQPHLFNQSNDTERQAKVD